VTGLDPEKTVPIKISEALVGPPVRKKMPKKKLIVAGAGVFAIAVVALTLIEVGLGHPISGGNQGTSLTGFFGGHTTGPQPTHHNTTTTPTTTEYTTPLLIIPTISSYAPTSNYSFAPTTETPETTTETTTTTTATTTTTENPSVGVNT
jgi:hypothetical protein